MVNCGRCNTEYTDNCDVITEFDGYSVKIRKKKEGVFNNIKEVIKARVCSKCGQVEFYVENYKKFHEE